MENSEKKKNVGILLLIILLIVIIGIVLIIIFFNKKEVVLNNKQEPQTIVNDENTTINSDIIRCKKDIIIDSKLKNNLYILLQEDVLHEYYIKNLFKVNNINEIELEEKLNILLNWLLKNNNFKKFDSNFLEKYDGKKGLSDYGYDVLFDDKNNFVASYEYNSDRLFTTYIDEELVEIEYNLIFEDKYNNNESIDIVSCPNNFLYDNYYKIYIPFDGCGGTPGISNLLYIYDYNENNNKYNLYISVGYKTFEEKEGKIYRSLISNEIYKEVQYEDTDEENAVYIYSFQIDDNNYQEFDHFKIMFEKNSEGNYIFKSVEKISA